MLINNVQDITQFLSVCESLKFTSLLSHKDDSSIIQHKIKIIITEIAEDTVINVLCCFNFLFHEFIHISECQSFIFILTMLIQIISTITFSSITLLISTSSHTHMNIIKFKNIELF